jgi:hypothetical protein
MATHRMDAPRRAPGSRWFRAAIMVLGATLGLLALGDAAPGAGAQPLSIEGSWRVHLPGERDDRALIAFLPGGVVIFTNTPSQPNDDAAGGRDYATLGLGAWSSFGGGRFGFAGAFDIYGSDGTAEVSVDVDASVTLSADGNRFTGTYTVRVTLLATGAEVFTSSPQPVEGTRIRAPASR